jgi:hypothetical protein
MQCTSDAARCGPRRRSGPYRHAGEGDDPAAGSTALVVLNKTFADASLTLAVDSLVPQAFDFPSLSVTRIQVPDAPGGAAHVIRYTPDLADAGAGPVTVQ